MSKRVFSGIQPTGSGYPHLGNYLGAIKGYVELQNEHDAIYCIVDQHATTVSYDPSTLKTLSAKMTASLLGCGVDTSKAILFKQSTVYEHSMLEQVLSHIATVGQLERMTQYKDKSAKCSKKSGINLGILTYPVLMAADILLYHTDLVPVGDDQHQHLQLTCELAKRFNHNFKNQYFKEPEKVFSDSKRVMSLSDPTKKMSKSDPAVNGTVYITDSLDVFAKKYRKAKSDSEMFPTTLEELESNPVASNLAQILAGISGQSIESVLNTCGGKGYSVIKNSLIEAHESVILPIGNRILELEKDDDYIKRVLIDGRDRCRVIASKTIQEVYDLVGLGI